MKVNVDFFAGDVNALEENLSRVRGFEHIEAAQESALAAAGGTDYGNDLALGNVLVYSFEHLEVAEAFAKIHGFNHLLLSLLSYAPMSLLRVKVTER